MIPPDGVHSPATGLNGLACIRAIPLRVSGRMVVWVAASVILHFAIVLSMNFYAPARTGPRTLQVELRTIHGESNEPLTKSGPEFDLPETTRALEFPKPEATPDIAPTNNQKDIAPAKPGLPADIYFRSGEVDRRAEPLNEVDLVYPLQAFRMRQRGFVRVELFVNEQGHIDKIAVEESSPPGIFEEAALEAARAQQFSPAMKDGRPVKIRMRIEIVFDPHERTNPP
jgi:TonB family protein